jgi:phycocyanobilin lyase beta subunit
LAALPPHDRLAVRERCLVALERARADGEWVVRYAVAVAVESLCSPQTAGDPLQARACLCLQALCGAEEETEVVRLRAETALRRLEA